MAKCSCSWWRMCNTCRQDTIKEQDKARTELLPRIEEKRNAD